MRRTYLLCLTWLLIAAVGLAEDFWVKKEYMQWTDEEVKKVMTNSPWAKDVTVSAPMAALGGGRGQRAAGGPPSSSADVENPGAGGGGRRGRGGRGGGGDDGGGAPPEAIVTFNVSWRSAALMRRAVVRSRLGAGAAVPQDAQELIGKDPDDYVIVVMGVPAGMARQLQNNVLLDKSTIRAGKKPPVAAKALNISPRTQTIDVIYTFPKTPQITSEDKEVEVVLRLGQIEVKRKFVLKDMAYMGKLDL